MKILHVVLCLTLFPSLSVCSKQKDARPHSATITYELYSWQKAGEVWCFSILTMTDRAKSAEEIFDKHQMVCSVASLKQKISRMSRGTQLVWMKNPYEGTTIRGTESVVWPPEDIMNEVKKFAATRHVEVVW
jgi:hypothetical protein